MKAHKVCPLSVKENNKLTGVIELTWEELLAVHKLLDEVISAARERSAVVLNFEKSRVSGLPMVSCIYEQQE